MASLPLKTAPARSSQDRERLFFLAMSLAMAAMVVGGFGLRIVLGVTNFAQPWWVHVHAVSFMGWITLYVAQNALVAAHRVDLHRRLGIAGAVFAAWIVVVGLALTVQMVAEGRSPPFFTPGFFLVLNALNAAFFAGLFYLAIALRARADWHRRLMLCAVLCVSIPGIARWIILSGLTPGPWLHVLTVGLLLVPAAVFDLRTRGRVHPAYICGYAALVVMTMLIAPLSRLPVVVRLADAILAHGTFF